MGTGRTAVVDKAAPIDYLMETLASLVKDEPAAPQIDSALPNPTIDPFRISEREWRILQLVSNGLSSKEIADELALSVRTVSNHRYRVMRKLGARNAVEMIRIAQQSGKL
jgi:DNA-binding NarL/FixJ family response regulator